MYKNAKNKGVSMTRCWRLVIVCLILLSGLPHSAIAQTPALDVTAFALPGERVVSIQPPLRYRGHVYTVHYFTTGSYSRQDPVFFTLASSDYFQRQQISGLLVTADGQRVVDDEETLRLVFSLYPAAYLLYTRRTLDSLNTIDDSFVDDLRSVTRNPLFVEQQVKALFSTRTGETAEALRGVFTSQVAPPSALADFGAAVREGAGQGSTVIAAVDETLEVARFSNSRSVRIAAKDIRKIFNSWTPVTEQATSFMDVGKTRIEFFNALDVVTLGTRLVWLADLQRDRADWLVAYMGFARGEALLDWDQLIASGVVVEESYDNWKQRGAIILQFVGESTRDLGLRLTTEALAKKWVDWSWKKYGTRTTGHLVAGAASRVLLGLTISNLIYGLDDLFNNFKTGERADELRRRFRAGRYQLQAEVAARADDVYDGELASKFRAVYMLESLSAVQTYRSYADGVDATVRQGLFALINPIAWFKGKEWRQAAQEIRDIANQLEEDAEDRVGHPEFIDAALLLVASRAPVIPQAISDLELDGSLPSISTWLGELQQWLQDRMGDLETAVQEMWDDLVQGTTTFLQDQVDQLRATLAENLEAWWRDFWAALQRRLAEELARQVNEIVQQLCGGPLALVLAAAAIVWQRRR
jgi:hypothetical protein